MQRPSLRCPLGVAAQKVEMTVGIWLCFMTDSLSFRIVGTFALLHASEGCAAIRAAIVVSCGTLLLI